VCVTVLTGNRLG